jgi:hypothetical protein
VKPLVKVAIWILAVLGLTVSSGCKNQDVSLDVLFAVVTDMPEGSLNVTLDGQPQRLPLIVRSHGGMVISRNDSTGLSARLGKTELRIDPSVTENALSIKQWITVLKDEGLTQVTVWQVGLASEASQQREPSEAEVRKLLKEVRVIPLDSGQVDR